MLLLSLYTSIQISTKQKLLRKKSIADIFNDI